MGCVRSKKTPLPSTMARPMYTGKFSTVCHLRLTVVSRPQWLLLLPLLLVVAEVVAEVGVRLLLLDPLLLDPPLLDPQQSHVLHVCQQNLLSLASWPMAQRALSRRKSKTSRDS